MKPGASQCTDYYIKDRKNGELGESINHSLGADSHRLVLISGIMNASSLFASMLLSHSSMLNERYHDIAAAFNLGLGLSLTHMFNISVAFKGTLEFQDRNGNEVDPIVHKPHPPYPDRKPPASMSHKKR
jgi:hypothetical protein